MINSSELIRAITVITRVSGSGDARVDNTNVSKVGGPVRFSFWETRGKKILRPGEMRNSLVETASMISSGNSKL